MYRKYPVPFITKIYLRNSTMFQFPINKINIHGQFQLNRFKLKVVTALKTNILFLKRI